ncbi:uncharacterized protein (TIGR02001 family) [Humitalea rosea]|uniref:Uncharacterized protein (TIGR02001 family) n=1 Tax=Humitalea rosea TaxID=990373 RepID=A0A2W7IEF0_9PROT|nr:TorF family putative porin [Humitalea rosea]PZW44839.1 uncharacterized protein (TIGR02001 family) [Humitalea rosea]
MKSSIFAVVALACGLGAAAPAMAQTEIAAIDSTLTVTPAITTDYAFRGISQTRNRRAIQLSLDLEHSSGVYVGAFASNANFGVNGAISNNTRQEVDLLAGYRFKVGDLKLDIGGIYYTYPNYSAQPVSTGAGQFEQNYFEGAVKAAYSLEPLTLLAAVYVSPDFFNESGTSVYLEGGVDAALDFGFTFSARIGQQWIQRNNFSTREGNFGGIRDYANYSVSVSHELFAGFMASVGYYNTDLDKADCGGTSYCGQRVIATLSRPF